MARGEGLGNMLALLEKIQGRQIGQQERREDRAYRTGMAKWMAESKSQEQRELLKWKTMLEYGGSLQDQAIATEASISHLKDLLPKKDEVASDGYLQLLQVGIAGAEKQANTLRGRQKQYDSQMAQSALGIGQLQQRIRSAQEVKNRYDAGFKDEALAASVYELGKKTPTEKEGTIEAERLDAIGTKQAWDILYASGDITKEQSEDKILMRGVLNRAMGMSGEGVKQRLDLRRIEAQESQIAAYRARTTQQREGKDVDKTIGLRDAFRDLMETANKTGDRGMYLKAKEGYDKLLPFGLRIMGGKEDIIDMPKDVIDTIVDAAQGSEPIKLPGIGAKVGEKGKRITEELNRQQQSVSAKASEMLDKLIEANVVSKRNFMPSRKFAEYTRARALQDPKDKSGDEQKKIYDAYQQMQQWEDSGYLNMFDEEESKLME